MKHVLQDGEATDLRAALRARELMLEDKAAPPPQRGFLNNPDVDDASTEHALPETQNKMKNEI